MLDGVPLLAGSVDIKDYFAAIAVTLLVGIVNLAAAVFHILTKETCKDLNLRQREDELCANALCADDIDMFIVSLNGLFDDGKSEIRFPFLSFPRDRSDLLKAFPRFYSVRFFGIPIPVSLTETKTFSFFSVTSIVIEESFPLNLIALSMRL